MDVMLPPLLQPQLKKAKKVLVNKNARPFDIYRKRRYYYIGGDFDDVCMAIARGRKIYSEKTRAVREDGTKWYGWDRGGQKFLKIGQIQKKQ